MVHDLLRTRGLFVSGSVFVLVGCLLVCCSDPPPTPKRLPFEPSLQATAMGTEMAAETIRGIEDVRDKLDSLYRLKPDRRFLLAAGLLYSFFTGTPPEAATAEFSSGKWHISIGGETVGEVADLPDFAELLETLEAFASDLHAAHPLQDAAPLPNADVVQIERELRAFLLPHPARALRALDALWTSGAANRALLPLASEALTAASIQMLDYTEICDEMPAQALAMTALAKSLIAGDTAREECLLALEMGYSSVAQSLAQRLEAEDPVRLYAEFEDVALLEAALKSDALPRTKFLALRRVAAQHKVELFRKTSEILFPSSDPGSAAYSLMDPVLRVFGDQVGNALMVMVAIEAAADMDTPRELSAVAGAFRAARQNSEKYAAFMRQLHSDLNSRGTTLLADYQRAIAGLDAGYHGPFLPAALWRDYYQAAMYSALFTNGRYFTHSLSSTPAARDYLAALERAGGGNFSLYTDWYKGLVASKAGDMGGKEYWQTVVDNEELPTQMLLQAHEELKRSLDYGDPMEAVAVQQVASRLDSRPHYRTSLADLFYDDLMDLQRAERLYRSVIESAARDHQGLLAWWGYFVRDASVLHEALAKQHLDPVPNYRALGNLESMGAVDDAFIRAAFQRLAAEFPEHYRLHLEYSRYLERQGDLFQARQVLRDWAGRKVEAAGLEHDFVRTRLAALYNKEGEHRKALESLASSYQAGSMSQRMHALVGLGERREAMDTALRMVDRYPDSVQVRSNAAWLYWTLSDYEKAAQILAEAPHALRFTDYSNTVSAAFYQAFENRPKEDAVAAFQALIQVGLDPLGLEDLCHHFYWAENFETAFALVSQIKLGGMYGALIALDSYRYLAGWRGPEEAAGWLREQVHANFLEPLSLEIYRKPEHFSLLWDLYPDPSVLEHGEFTWLLRACAAVREGLEGHPKREALLDYYGASSDKFYDRAGKFLLGLVPESELLELVAKDPRKLGEVAYYIGLRAQSENRLHDAADWYHTCVRTGLRQNGEYSWAHDALYHMRGRNASLSVQEQEPTHNPRTDTKPAESEEDEWVT